MSTAGISIALLVLDLIFYFTVISSNCFVGFYDNAHLYGLVNLAAFIGQSMKEPIQYDACDENSWDLVDGKYPLSNACGQLGQKYQEYHCSEEEKHMECPVDPNICQSKVSLMLNGTVHRVPYSYSVVQKLSTHSRDSGTTAMDAVM